MVPRLGSIASKVWEAAVLQTGNPWFQDWGGIGSNMWDPCVPQAGNPGFRDWGSLVPRFGNRSFGELGT